MDETPVKVEVNLTDDDGLITAYASGPGLGRYHVPVELWEEYRAAFATLEAVVERIRNCPPPPPWQKCPECGGYGVARPRRPSSSAFPDLCPRCLGSGQVRQ